MPTIRRADGTYLVALADPVLLCPACVAWLQSQMSSLPGDHAVDERTIGDGPRTLSITYL
jgi:hypothetical protein